MAGKHVFGRRHAGCDLAARCTSTPQAFADAAFGGTVRRGRGVHPRAVALRRSRHAGAHLRRQPRADESPGLRLVADRAARCCSLFHWANRNSRNGSARNIAAHYDLGNALYEIMLDETMAYSCAIFPRADATLAEGVGKRSSTRCAASSTSNPRDHVLEIGTGWGGFAIHAAQRYGCRVTTTTISARAARLRACARSPRSRLSDRITVLLLS